MGTQGLRPSVHAMRCFPFPLLPPVRQPGAVAQKSRELCRVLWMDTRFAYQLAAPDSPTARPDRAKRTSFQVEFAQHDGSRDNGRLSGSDPQGCGAGLQEVEGARREGLRPFKVQLATTK